MAFLAKPFAPGDLVGQVAALLDGGDQPGVPASNGQEMASLPALPPRDTVRTELAR